MLENFQIGFGLMEVADEKTPEPDKDIDDGGVEMKRLMKLGVLRDAQPSDESIQRTLTTRFVFDWRWKPFGKAEGEQEPQYKWLRRARLVAREYAFAEGKRDDVFSPASSSHLLRLLPALYLCKTALDEFTGDDPYVLGSLDVKDAFLQVDQREPLRLKMSSGDFIVMKNSPGQRAGAKDWFDHISKFLCTKAEMTQCCLNPCLMRSPDIAVLVHVDDVMLLGKRKYVENVFLPLLTSQFDLSCSLIKDVGDEFTFLKRTYSLTQQGLIISPGNYVPKMLEIFEENYGKVKSSKVPIDPNMLVEDQSDELSAYDSGIYRSFGWHGTLLSPRAL